MNFLRDGDPNPIPRLPTATLWPDFAEDQKVMNFGADNQASPNIRVSIDDSLLDGPRCDYWQSAPYYYPVEDKARLVKQGTSYKLEI